MPLTEHSRGVRYLVNTATRLLAKNVQSGIAGNG